MAIGDCRRACGPLLAGLGLIALAHSAGALAGKDEDAMRERIARLERTLSSSALVDMAKQLEAMQQEVRQLHGDLENQSYALEQLRKSQREAYMDADRRLGALEQGHAAVAGGAPPEPPLETGDSPSDVAVAGKPSDQSIVAVDTGQALAAPSAGANPPTAGVTAGAVGAAGMAPPAAASLPPGAPPRASTVLTPAGNASSATAAATAGVARSSSPEAEVAYREAFAVLKAGQYEKAIGAFSLYLQKYPNSQDADNAQYWIGECYYVLRQYEPAIAQYQKLIAGYPDSLKVAQAMLKIGYAYDKLGKSETAASELLQLKQKFPGSAPARLADEQLARMKVTAKSP